MLLIDRPGGLMVLVTGIWLFQQLVQRALFSAWLAIRPSRNGDF
jgi:hypothetical protein